MDEFLQILQAELDIIRRRLRGMAMISRGIVPNLIISQRVVNRVLEAARHFLADETGETMVGLVLEPDHEPEAMPTLLVIDTIAPDESVIRRSHMFEQGDELQQDIFLWLLDNWNTYLEIGKDMSGKPVKEEWKVPLKHLGDWHKQPGYMIQPSGGDLMTALRIMDDEENDFDFLLVPIVTLGHDTVTTEEGAIVNYFTVPMEDGTSLRMDWWYIHRDVRIFQPITPRIVPEADLPKLTPYPWHVLNQDLLDSEQDLLDNDGLILVGETTILWEADGDLPLEICFIVARAGTNKVFLVVTNWDYPRSAPTARLATFQGIDASMYIYDIFEHLWKNSEVINLPAAAFQWTANKHLVDYLAAVENHLGMRPPARKSPARQKTPVSIPVDVEAAAPESASAKTTTEDGTGDAANPTIHAKNVKSSGTPQPQPAGEAEDGEDEED